MELIEKAVRLALCIAEDNSHGYDQTRRWGPDYDCSSLIISAYEQAGVPVKTNGATYTGNMASVFKKCGFRDVTASVNLATGSGLQRGDVLLHHTKHTALYIGSGQIVHASSNENKKATGGKTGDQTGAEICTRSYYNYPWQAVLRYAVDKKEDEDMTLPTLKKGSKSQSVRALQALLDGYGYKLGNIDGDFGVRTHSALCRYQSDFGLVVDGICGEKTWAALLGA